MTLRVRFVFCLILFACIGLVMPSHGYAAITAAEWRTQLQNEMRNLSQKSSMLKIQGDVTVKQEGSQLIAALPILTITASDLSYLSVPSITLYADAASASSGQVKIRLPETVYYRNANGDQRGSVKLTEQNISGSWNFAGNYFENLNGTLGNLIYHDQASQTQATIAQIQLNASNPQQPKLEAQKIQSIIQSNGSVIRNTIANAVLDYQFNEGAKLTLTRVIGLLNPVWLLADNQAFTIGMTANDYTHIDRMARVTKVQNLSTRLQVQPKGDGVLLGGRMGLVAQNITQTPETSYSFALPTKLSLLGTVSNMPVQVLSQPFSVAQDFMVESGTRADISEIVWDTSSSASLKGTGWLKAAANVPLGMVGRFALNITDLRAMNAQLQKQLATPGTDIKVKTQGLMLLMVLQGMVKDGDSASQIVLDLTQDGQVLVNGSDISALVTGTSGLKSFR